MCGIVVTFLGAYILQMRELSWLGLSFPLRNLRVPGVLLALSAGACCSGSGSAGCGSPAPC